MNMLKRMKHKINNSYTLAKYTKIIWTYISLEYSLKYSENITVRYISRHGK